MRYSAPSVSPVREKIVSAQGSIAHAITAAGAANAAIARAEKIAGSPSATPAENPDSQLSTNDSQLQEALAEASGSINDLTTKLESARADTADSQTLIDQLETKVGIQTNGLNTCGDEKNAAIDATHALQVKSQKDARKYHHLKFAVCSLAAALACFLALRLGLLRLLAFLGPYCFIGIAAVPALVFTALWFLL